MNPLKVVLHKLLLRFRLFILNEPRSEQLGQQRGRQENLKIQKEKNKNKWAASEINFVALAQKANSSESSSWPGSVPCLEAHKYASESF